VTPRFTALLATDLDGTLLTSQRRATEQDLKTLHQLGQDRVCRAVVTGRSLHSARRALPADFPIDYLVFSSGAGIVDWRTGELLVAHQISASEVARAIDVLLAHRVNFMVHEPVPENHRFRYCQTCVEDTDFIRRRDYDPSLAVPLATDSPSGPASQLLAVIPLDLERFAALRASLTGLQVIRTTSPLDKQSIWVEVFPPHVSKASGCEWLANRFGIPHPQTYCLGNDYNDLHMLQWGAHAAVVANAPPDLRQQFAVVSSHEHDALTSACASWASCGLPPGVTRS